MSISIYTSTDLNECSLVLEIAYGKTTLILPGDIDHAVENIALPIFEKDVQVLLVSPHRGSRYLSSEEFLDALQPRAIA